MTHDHEMQSALIADGEKLLALTGEDHGPWEVGEGKWQVCPHANYMSEDFDEGVEPIQIIDGNGKTVACNTTFYPTAITAEHAATIVEAVNELVTLREQLATARAALLAYQDIVPKVMTALMATQGRDDLLLAHAVHQLTYPAYAALGAQP